jgi:hypothetical protein
MATTPYATVECQMIEIHGPTYRYAEEVLEHPEIIYIRDHHYDETAQCFHVKQLLENSRCDPQQHLLVFDHINAEYELADFPHVCLPTFLSRENQEFIQQQITPCWTNKTTIFNFMINKPRPHREFLLTLLGYFKLDNYSHSLCWQHIAKTLQVPQYQHIIDTVPLDVQSTNYVFGSEIWLDRGLRNGSYKNAHTYQGLLQHTVFEPSCISLITEPAFYEKETIVTEKTLMAICGGTMPLWVGGWRIPEYMSQMGFDIFSDVIDHSYQNEPDPWDRCYCAIERNLDLLKKFNVADLDTARLQHNYDLLQKNVFLQDVKQKITTIPAIQSIYVLE